jgi:antirestriction protein ArdC
MATESAKSTKKPATEKKASVYDVVTAQVIDMLQAGVCPWRKPWVNQAPRNGKSGRRYHGINTFILGMSPFADPRWFTFKQAQEMGGMVRKGEKGRPVVFWTIREVEDKATGEKEQVPILKYSTVFNAEQVDGLELTPIAESHDEPLDGAQHVVDTYFAAHETLSLVHGGDEASYSPRRDTITMPHRTAFVSIESYYGTLFHEMGHSTGHSSRLGRFDKLQEKAHGDHDSYAKEELVAEMTAAFLNNEVGISKEIESTVAYLQGWIQVLKADPRILVQAAGKAKKAADLILGVAQSTEADQPAEQVAPVATPTAA